MARAGQKAKRQKAKTGSGPETEKKIPRRAHRRGTKRAKAAVLLEPRRTSLWGDEQQAQVQITAGQRRCTKGPPLLLPRRWAPHQVQLSLAKTNGAEMGRITSVGQWHCPEGWGATAGAGRGPERCNGRPTRAHGSLDRARRGLARLTPRATTGSPLCRPGSLGSCWLVSSPFWGRWTDERFFLSRDVWEGRVFPFFRCVSS